MEHLLRRIKKNYSIWLYLFFILLSILLFNTNRPFKYAITSIFSSSILYPFENLTEYLHEVGDYREENLKLKKRNIELSLEVNQLKELEKENERLRTLLDFKDKLDYETKLASVIGKGDGETSSILLIDAGDDKNIQENSPVIAPGGLIGKVVKVNSTNSYIQLITDPNLKISAMDLRSRVKGIVKWKGGGFLEMIDVPITKDVKYGDAIITSPYSNIFPKGLKIGTVHRVLNMEDRLFKIIDILPSVNMSKIEEVVVLEAKAPEEEQQQ